MPLSREERKLLHQKSKQPTLGVGKPDNQDGYEGDISFRQIDGSGTVEYVKKSHEWVAVASSGEMPPVRIIGGTRGSVGAGVGITSHGDLAGLGDDNHVQYLLIDGSRAMTSTMIIGSDADGTDRSVVWGHSTLKTIMGIDDSADAFVINTDAAFDDTLANNSFSIDASHNVIIAGNLTIAGGDITLANGSTIDSSASAGTLLLTEDIVKSSASLQSTTTMTVGTDLTVTGGDIVYGNGQNATNTITATAHDAAGKNLTISAGNTTAGTTNNIAGGALTFQGGQGKGSGAGGDIIFQTANAGSSGSTLNSLATALTISDDGNVGINVSDPDVKLEVLSTSAQQKWSYDADSYATITVAGTSTATVATAESGDLHLDIAGDIILSADGGNVTFLDGSSLALNIDMDDTAGDAVFKDAGNTEIFRIDGSENSVRFNSYSLNNSDPYPVSIKPLNSTQHMTMGLADKQNNYSMIGIFSAAAAGISGVTADGDFDDW